MYTLMLEIEKWEEWIRNTEQASTAILNNWLIEIWIFEFYVLADNFIWLFKHYWIDFDLSEGRRNSI